MPINRALVGKQYVQSESFVVTAENALAYALASNAGDVDAYQSGKMAPPMFGVAFSFGALAAPMLDPDLSVDMMRLVHGEQAMDFLLPVVAGDVITSVSTVASVDEKNTGELLNIAIESKNQRGEVILRATSGLFIRSGGRGKDKEKIAAERAARDAEEAAYHALDVVFTEQVTVAADQSVRYADASGDHNPIHVDEEIAKMAGLPGIILHGLCTMAFVHNAVVRHVDGDPTKVKHLAVRFARPVLMNDVLTVEARRQNAETLALRVVNQSGTVVLSGGLAVLG